MKPKRIEYIDVAKFAAILLIIFSHGLKEGHLLAFLFSFHLPVFYFLNGMTLKMEGHTFGDFLTTKLRRYIVPMFGLGILCVLSEALAYTLLKVPLPDNYYIIGLSRVINQTRSFTIWFLPALFFTDIILFGFHKLFKDRLIPMGLGALAVLGLGICFTLYYNVPLVWNSDAALFGTVFTYCGYAFRHAKFSRIYGFLTGNRIVALLVGIPLLVATYFVSVYNYDVHLAHFEMFLRIYTAYYITLPCALMGTVGFTLLCRGITNPVLAKPVEANLALLALHQGCIFPIFRYVVAPQWWNSVAFMPASDPHYLAFNFTMLLFSLGTIAVAHFAIKFSPFAPIINQPIPAFYRKPLGKAKAPSSENADG